MLQILLQAGGGGQAWMQLVFIGGIILIFYFFMIRPQQQKQKEQKKFVDALKPGDKIVTIGGMHGKVVAIEEGLVVVEADKGIKLRFEKSAISYENSKVAQKS